MEQKEFRKRFPQVDADHDINPMATFEHHFFKKETKEKTYQELAFDKCIQEKLEFCATFNSLSLFFNKMIIINCPVCGQPMEAQRMGGNCSQETYTLRCLADRVETWITLPREGMGIKFY